MGVNAFEETRVKPGSEILTGNEPKTISPSLANASNSIAFSDALTHHAVVVTDVVGV